jgi:phosphoribosylformylglycinamidine cyclo-ligase
MPCIRPGRIQHALQRLPPSTFRRGRFEICHRSDALMTGLTYKDAGVDLDLYEDSMARVQRLISRTFTPRVRRLDGGFAGLFQLDFSNRMFARNYERPILIASTDGVGTKLKVATLAGKHNTVGIDLVAMSVNDCLCLGAEPLFFLDYVAMSHDDPPLLEAIVEGVTAGCLEADCALLGGETAIMPDLYAPGDYDLAGFCVGVAEDRRVIDGQTISAGDTVLGIASSGLHSNGYSLVRKIVFQHAGLKIDDIVPELGRTVGEELLTPTRIYTRPVRQILARYKVKQVVHGIAHITGGGLQDNLDRIIPSGLHAAIDRASWPVPAVFCWLQRLGNVADDEMAHVFNMGIGLVLVVSDYYAESIRRQLADLGLESWQIGVIQRLQG